MPYKDPIQAKEASRKSSREYQRRKMQSAEYREKKAEYMRLFWKSNEKSRLKRNEKAKAYRNTAKGIEVAKQHAEKQRLSGYNKAHRKTWKLTDEQFEAMKASQGYACAICNEITTLVIDHSHTTGMIRGLLCNPCNKGIGHLKDNIQNMQKAIDYLSRTTAM